MLMESIEDAVHSGWRRAAACSTLDLSLRTYQRWTREDGNGKADGRKGSRRGAQPTSSAKMNGSRFLWSPTVLNLPAVRLARLCRRWWTGGISGIGIDHLPDIESRATAASPESGKEAGHCATEANHLWAWGITWLPAGVKDMYFYWHMVLDIYSRKIVGHEGHVAESAELASLLLRTASLAEGLAGREVVLHSDNGSPMKGATMLATLEKLDIMPSFSRPRVSNDSAYLRRVLVPGPANTGRPIRQAVP
jgi:putative transposase